MPNDGSAMMRWSVPVEQQAQVQRHPPHWYEGAHDRPPPYKKIAAQAWRKAQQFAVRGQLLVRVSRMA